MFLHGSHFSFLSALYLRGGHQALSWPSVASPYQYSWPETPTLRHHVIDSGLSPGGRGSPELRADAAGGPLSIRTTPIFSGGALMGSGVHFPTASPPSCDSGENDSSPLPGVNHAWPEPALLAVAVLRSLMTMRGKSQAGANKISLSGEGLGPGGGPELLTLCCQILKLVLTLHFLCSVFPLFECRGSALGLHSSESCVPACAMMKPRGRRVAITGLGIEER
ncbi:hypothetical protein Cadr_000021776 [Camelus dromedarius]|uniref:Uncharacterized protein n=1 Tax=Camelus dromedarius TaxID=9838 RepID=A0A5N4CS40_CAMDR|nr:hypothetical protein Cadr_000021776 [Camelus dromedarius]